MINETKIINSYARAYFTFKSKNPDDTVYSGVEFHAFNDMISETISGYSVLSFYLTFILVIGSYVADFLASEPEKIMFSDLPHPESVVELCEGIKISRFNQDFKEEEYLYTILIELMRTPHYLKELTQSSLKNFNKRNQNNVEDDNLEEKEKEDLLKEEQEDEDDDDDDENDEFYDHNYEQEKEEKEKDLNKKPNEAEGEEEEINIQNEKEDIKEISEKKDS